MRKQTEKVSTSHKTFNIAHPLTTWATALGESPRSLERCLIKAGIIIEKRQPVTAKQIVAAKMGDEQVEKVRNLRADADRKERENAQTAGELIRFSEFDAIWTQHQALPLRQWLQDLPTSWDSRLDSEHPERARGMLIQIRDECMRLLRDNLPKPPTKI